MHCKVAAAASGLHVDAYWRLAVCCAEIVTFKHIVRRISASPDVTMRTNNVTECHSMPFLQIVHGIVKDSAQDRHQPPHTAAHHHDGLSMQGVPPL